MRYRLWNGADARHFKTIGIGSSWITDGCYMPGARKLVFTTVDRAISYYDANRGSFELTGRVYASGEGLGLGAWGSRGRGVPGGGGGRTRLRLECRTAVGIPGSEVLGSRRLGFWGQEGWQLSRGALAAAPGGGGVP